MVNWTSFLFHGTSELQNLFFALTQDQPRQQFVVTHNIVARHRWPALRPMVYYSNTDGLHMVLESLKHSLKLETSVLIDIEVFEAEIMTDTSGPSSAN